VASRADLRADVDAALEFVGITTMAGRMTALLGANGAGKSELVLAVAGLLPVAKGIVTVGGTTITGAKPDRIRAAGVALLCRKAIRS
jgi:branched-chain amino acid transport system ATP-binding protein